MTPQEKIDANFPAGPVRDGIQSIYNILVTYEDLMSGRSLTQPDATNMLGNAFLVPFKSPFTASNMQALRSCITEAIKARVIRGQPSPEYFVDSAVMQLSGMFSEGATFDFHKATKG